MCMTKKELEAKVQEFRSLKAMKEELENELKAVEYSIIEYMTENELDTEITDTAKITYKPQNRTTLDKEKLTEILGEDLKPFEKTTSYNVLRVKQSGSKRVNGPCVGFDSPHALSANQKPYKSINILTKGR